MKRQEANYCTIMKAVAHDPDRHPLPDKSVSIGFIHIWNI